MAARTARRHAGMNSGGGWRESKALAILLVLVIVVVWVAYYLLYYRTTDSSIRISNFPFTFMAEGATEPFIEKSDSNSPKPTPFKDKQGQWCWPAYVCNNPVCPGRQGDTPFIFPYVDTEIKKLVAEGKFDPAKPNPEDGMLGMRMMSPEMRGCERCKAAGKAFMMIDRYYTPEGHKLLADLVKKHQAQMGVRDDKKK